MGFTKGGHEPLLVPNVGDVDQEAARCRFDLSDPLFQLSESIATLYLAATAAQTVPGYKQPFGNHTNREYEEGEGHYLGRIGEHTDPTNSGPK